MLKKSLIAVAILVALAIAFVAVPMPAFDDPAPDPARMAELEARGEEHFNRVVNGQNLDRPFPPMVQRPDNPLTEARIELGRLLYFDPLLSGDNDVSCAHCHHPDLGLSDNRGRSMGKGGQGLGPDRTGGALLRRGSPTVWNSAYNHLQFWDGRARDLEEQAGKPIQDPNEMAQDPDELVDELRAIPEYVELFNGAFEGNETLTFDNVTYAIATFERTLISNDSRYDRYARGDRQALSDGERRGLNIFRSLKTRCFECHNLPTFANPDFKIIGVPDPEDLDAPDLGRAEIAGGEAYEHAFKVPTLRNIALTAPYMHNGRFETLAEVVDFYGRGGGPGEGFEVANLDDKIRPFELTSTERSDLVAFLHTLTDESAKPEIPAAVPSGLPTVPPLANQSPEMAAFVPEEWTPRAVEVERDDQGRLVVRPGQRIQDAVDAAQPGDTVVMMPGVYHETVTLDISGIRLVGEEIDGARAVLDGQGVLSDGIIGSGSDLEMAGFDVRHYTDNGIMINLGQNITFRDLHLDDTGLYGLYPVEVVGVLVEECEVSRTRDAGIYVGQSKDIVVRNNTAHGNVTGIEIENSVNALVENNHVYNNTGGILVFALPNVPSKVSRDCRVIGNRVIENNHENFADPNAIVAGVPSGTGIMVLASDEVEIAENEIRGNNSFGIAIVGLDTQFGAGSTYDVDPNPDDVVVYGNEMTENGNAADPIVTEAGYSGADLLWDLAGTGHSWDQPGASRMPYSLPNKDWPEWRQRATVRLWRLLAAAFS